MTQPQAIENKGRTMRMLAFIGRALRLKRPICRGIAQVLRRSTATPSKDYPVEWLWSCAGVAKLTASMVRLGLLGTVHDIVVSLCAQDKADVVAKVTAALLTLQEIAVVTQITNSLVASGHVKDAVAIGSKFIHKISAQSVLANPWPAIR